MQGTWYMYNAFFMPFLARHEPRISRKLQEIRDKSGDLLFFYIKNFTEKGQSMFFELLSYFVKEASGPPPTQGSGRPTDPPPSAPPMPAQDSRHRRRGGRNPPPEAEYQEQVNRNGGSEMDRFMRDGPFDYLRNDHLRRRD
ncbi:hypothetical protein Taro_046039 [Colocasia esculenta]|uniref:HVA22-like protein n=1 Tax=Colocasia esculenta TaxID=4460 RepID=A0A843WY19_COLES|nr:hypothetical protein [Colocasia esculenta]